MARYPSPTDETGATGRHSIAVHAPAAGRRPATPIDLSAWGAVYDFSDDDEGLDESKQAPAPTAAPAAAPPAPAPAPEVALVSTPPRQRPQATPSSAAAELRHDGTPRAATQHAAAEVGSSAADHTWQGSLGRARIAARDAYEGSLDAIEGSLDRVHTAALDVAAAVRAASEMLTQRELWATFGGGLARACHRRRAALAYAGACLLAICAQRGTVRGRLEPDTGPGIGAVLCLRPPFPADSLTLTSLAPPAHARSTPSRPHLLPARCPRLHPPPSPWQPLALSLLRPQGYPSP